METGPNLFGCPWEWLTCATIGFGAVLLFVWRICQSVRSRLYERRERQLALKRAGLIEETCELLEKVSLVQKEYEGLESSLKDAIFEKESVEAPNLGAIYEELDRSKSKLGDEILFLEKEEKGEETKHSQQVELMADISKRIKSLEDDSKALKSEIAEAKTTLRIFQRNGEEFRVAIKEALNENSQLQESQKQLLQEAEAWKEKVNDLNKQKIKFEDSKVRAEQVLRDQENHIKSPTELLLNMKDWAPVLGEGLVGDGNWELEMNGESEIGVHLDDQLKGALNEWVYAPKLNGSFKTLEGERNQIFTLSSDVIVTREDLIERIKTLKTEKASLQSKNIQLKSENQNLQQKLQGVIEQYQENVMKLQRKLIVEEIYRVEREEKLSKADENISRATEQLETYRKQVKNLEEELERTIHSHEAQIVYYEKKAHDNELAARSAERYLNILRKENIQNRQKLTENDFKLKLLEKGPCALGDSNPASDREHSPNGPSPLGPPSSERRAPLLEKQGPLRLSPLVPVEGERGSRGPENPLGPQIINERGESRYDGFTDPRRAPYDTGLLSPPWEQTRRRMIPPPGQPYSGPRLPLQRQDGWCLNYGRPSGPAELRSSKVPSLDKVDGPVSSEMESSRNVDLGHSNVPDSPLPAENQATGSGSAFPPTPPIRGPWIPVDPRSQFMTGGPFSLPPPPGNMYGAPREYLPPGPPPPSFPSGNVCSPRGFPQYLPPRAGFPPPPPAPHSESRSEFPAGLIPPSNEPATDHPEPQENSQ